MEPLRQKIAARVILALSVALGLAWLAHLDFAQKIPTDVLELVPPAERAPEIAMVRAFASNEQARVALFALNVTPREAEAEQAEENAASRDRAAEAFIAALAKSPAFAEVVRMDDTGPRDALGKYVFDHRLDLFAPGWLAAREHEYAATDRTTPFARWLAEQTAVDLEKFLGTPEAMAFQDLVPADPLLLVPHLIEHVRAFAGAPGAQDQNVVLIWARAAGSPLSEAGQEPVFAAVNDALSAARAIEPHATLRWTAVSRFAAESRRRIESEMSGLNLFSLAAVLGIAAVCVRRVHKALHLVPVVLLSFLGAWTITTLVFPRVHVLVFVVGSLLGGVAIDYGFYLYLQPRRPGELYRGRVRRLLKPLLASALTTVLGFSLLLFSELPLIRQIGVFVSAGLLSALAAALLWFAQIEEPMLETRAWIRPRARSGSRARRTGVAALLGIGAIIALVGPFRLHWRDDIRELEIPAADLRANDAAVRSLFGETPGRTLYLTRGDSPGAARTSLEKFLTWHETAFPDAPVASIGLALPTPEAWRRLPEFLRDLAGFPEALQAALAKHGFDGDAFTPFLDAWRTWAARETRPDYDELAGGFARELHGPLAMFMSRGSGVSWFASVADHVSGAEPPAETATVSANQLESLNHLFARYRESALHLSAIGLLLLGASVFVLYGWRRGVRIFAIPAGACLFAFGVFGVTGQALNLFHLLGAFLGVCLSHNYAIFSAENAAAGEAPPPSIRLSAMTTAASFGVLALSRIPVVAALGTTVAIIVIAALVMTECIGLRRPQESAAAASAQR